MSYHLRKIGGYIVNLRIVSFGEKIRAAYYSLVSKMLLQLVTTLTDADCAFGCGLLNKHDAIMQR